MISPVNIQCVSLVLIENSCDMYWAARVLNGNVCRALVHVLALLHPLHNVLRTSDLVVVLDLPQTDGR